MNDTGETHSAVYVQAQLLKITNNPPSKKNLRVTKVYYLKCPLFNPKLLDMERNKI